MISIFKDSFGLPENRYIRTGIPRTDFFYDEIRKSKAIDRLQSDFPKINGKKVIMYAPTYRDGEFNSVNLQIDLEQIYEHFKHDYVLFLRSEEHTSELQSRGHLVCRLLLEKKKTNTEVMLSSMI